MRSRWKRYQRIRSWFLGAGMAIGQKFIIKYGWRIEGYLGGGIHHLNTDYINIAIPEPDSGSENAFKVCIQRTIINSKLKL